MPHSIAFLRAINVGGHTVKMDDLRQIFVSLGFSAVETFLASGNVIFETPSPDAASLERQIEGALRQALGYEVSTFIRTDVELARIVAYQPFPPLAMQTAVAYNIAFLSAPLDAPSIQKLLNLRTGIDDFAVDGSEIYWLCRKKQSDSTFSNAVLEKTLARRATLRGINTIQKLAAKYAAG